MRFWIIVCLSLCLCACGDATEPESGEKGSACEVSTECDAGLKCLSGACYAAATPCQDMTDCARDDDRITVDGQAACVMGLCTQRCAPDLPGDDCSAWTGACMTNPNTAEGGGLCELPEWGGAVPR